MTLFRPTYVAFALVSLFLAGCAGAGSAFRGGLSVSLVDFSPTEASLLESRGKLTLRFTNETIAPLGYSGSTHKLFLNGHYVGKAVSDQPFGVPPLNTVTQDVTVNFENLALVRQLISVRDTQTAAYRLESVLFQTVYEDKYQIKVTSEGALDLRSLASEFK
ncbi:MAG: LEA type 2 family protein [Opitutus sp.]